MARHFTQATTVSETNLVYNKLGSALLKQKVGVFLNDEVHNSESAEGLSGVVSVAGPPIS